MKYKILALDLDGTLLRQDGTLHARDRWAIKQLQNAGVHVTICTGRLYSGSREAAAAAQIEGPIACVDGSHIVSTKDDTEHLHKTLSGHHATTLRQVVERHSVASFVFAQDMIVYDADGEAWAPYVRNWSPNIKVVDRVVSHPAWEHERGVHAVVSIGPRGPVERAVHELSGQLGSEAFIATFPMRRRGEQHVMIVRRAGTSKGTAISWLAEHHGCSTKEVVAVGDWLNDIPMFNVAGRSFVMASAPPVVKEAATDALRAYSANDAGVAEAIERAWGKL